MRQEDWHWKLKDNKTLCSWRPTLYISPLLFQADPNHRVKVAGKIIYFVYKILVKQSRVDNALILWIKNTGERGTMLGQVQVMNWATDREK